MFLMRMDYSAERFENTRDTQRTVRLFLFTVTVGYCDAKGGSVKHKISNLLQHPIITVKPFLL